MDEYQSVTMLPVTVDPGHALLNEKNLRRAGIANSVLAPGKGSGPYRAISREVRTGHPAPIVPLLHGGERDAGTAAVLARGKAARKA